MPPSGTNNPSRSSAPMADTDAEGAYNHKTAGLLDYLGFPPSGRMKLLTYWTACCLWGSGIFLFAHSLYLIFHSPGSLFLLPHCLWLLVFVRLSILRCRDTRLSRWWAWLLLVLPVGLLAVTPGALFAIIAWIMVVYSTFFLCLSLYPSKVEEAAPRGSWKLFLVSITLLIIWVIAAHFHLL